MEQKKFPELRELDPEAALDMYMVKRGILPKILYLILSMGNMIFCDNDYYWC